MVVKKNERYLGDGLYACYDGFALWLRAPGEREDDQIVALEPDTLDCFIRYALKIERMRKIIGRAVNSERAKQLEAGPNYDTTIERDMDRDQVVGRDITND